MENHPTPTIKEPQTIKPPHELAEDLRRSILVSMRRRALTIGLIVGILAGIGGGVFGTYLALNNSFLKKYVPLPQSTVNQNVTLTEDSSVVDVVKQASPAVVSIVITKDVSGSGTSFNFNDLFPFLGQTPKSNTPNYQQVGAGSGFFVSSDGLILTNKHVVADEKATYSVLTSDQKSYDAQVLTRDPVNDLAILKITISGAPTLNLAEGSVEIGQRVIAIGNSLGQYQNTVTTGIVSGIGRSITAGSQDGQETLEGVIQTDAAINPGNSGGPLLNIAGQVVGINTAVDREGQLVGFAIPAGDARKALDSFNKTGKITRPYLGVRYLMINQLVADKNKLPKNYGALLIRGETVTDFAVLPGSPADKAGLVENDIILEVNGQKVDGTNTLSKLLKNTNVGDTLNLKIFHQGNEKTVQVKLEESK